MMNKTAAEKLGLAPAEERVFFNLEKPMPAPSQNLLEEGKEESRFDSFSSMKQTAYIGMLKDERMLFALELVVFFWLKTKSLS